MKRFASSQAPPTRLLYLPFLIYSATIVSMALGGLMGPGAIATHAQTSPLNPRDINPLPPTPPQQEIPPELLEDLDNPLSPPSVAPEAPQISPEILATTFFVTKITFENNTIFDDDTLNYLVREAVACRIERNATEEYEECVQHVPPEWIPQTLRISQLLVLAQAITDHYAEAGYTTSGALVSIPEETQNSREGEITFDIQEGTVEAINIRYLVEDMNATDEEIEATDESRPRLREGYVRSRLGITEGDPLNIATFQERLQFLQLDPLIEQIQAEVNQGATSATSIVDIIFKEAPSLSLSVGFNNNRPPSIGTDQGQVFFTQANLLGIGDGLSLGWSHTEGSDSLSVGYDLPLGSEGATLSFNFSPEWNDIVDPDFFDLDQDGEGPDIESESETYNIQLRYPVIRSINGQTYQELGFSLIGSLRDSRSFLFDEPFPLSPGASGEGKTRVVTLGFGQDYLLQDAVQVLAMRSQFNFGLNAFGSTINDPVPGIGEIPDSEFFSWFGQIQWVRALAPETVLVLRSNLQFADRQLLSSEKFGIGGAGSVRGYRQDRLLTDNGIFASAEVRFPVLRIPEWQSTVQLAPFVDVGTGWNSGDASALDPNTLASVGLGVRWQTSDNFSARLDWGIPLIDDGLGGDTWQENGLHFSVLYTPF
jgi:hemolysin activation/secretion protein